MELDAKPRVALNAAARSSGDGSGILYLKCEKSVIVNMREQKRGTEGSKTFVFEVRSGERKQAATTLLCSTHLSIKRAKCSFGLPVNIGVNVLTSANLEGSMRAKNDSKKYLISIVANISSEHIEYVAIE